MVDGNSAKETGKEGLTRRRFTLGMLIASIAGAFGSGILDGESDFLRRHPDSGGRRGKG